MLANSCEHDHLTEGRISGRRNSPLIHNYEEAADDRSCDGLRVELTYSSNKHSPGYAAQKTVDIGVNRSSCKVAVSYHADELQFLETQTRTLCPELDTSQGISEDGNIGD